MEERRENMIKDKRHICRECKYRYKLDTFEVCKLKKVHKAITKKCVKECENFKLKNEKNESEE